MRKRLLLLLFVVCLLCGLCACGGSGESTPPSNNNQVNATQPNNAQSSVSDSDPETDLDSDSINSTIESEQLSDDYSDDQAPDDIQLDDTQESDGPKGLIMMAGEYNEHYVTGTVIINTLDPETGSFQFYTQFPYGRIADGIYYTPGSNSAGSLGTGYYATRSEWFSPDYDKMAITWQSGSTGEYHAGWVNQDGELFDVTIALNLQPKSDFDDIVNYKAIGFTDDERFVYVDINAWNYYSVPMNNLTSDAIVEGLPLPGVGEKYMVSTADRITDYSTSGSYITNEQQGGVSQLHDASGNASTYVPGNNRLVWNGVFSPDESQIAFMSSPTAARASVDIYTVPVTGGDPVKVETSPELALGNLYIFGSELWNMLIDWK